MHPRLLRAQRGLQKYTPPKIASDPEQPKKGILLPRKRSFAETEELLQ